MKRYEADGTVNKVPRKQYGTKQERAVRALVVQWRSSAEKLLEAAALMPSPAPRGAPLSEERVRHEHGPRIEAAAGQLMICAEELEKALQGREP